MIVLTGDSWGVCEWSKNCIIEGPGLASYVNKCETSVNLSRGGSSNTQALDRLENFLSRYSPADDDIFIWVVSGPNRCITDIDSFLNSTTNLSNSLYNLLIASLTRANTIAKNKNFKLKLVGGVCDLNDINPINFSNLEFSVPSWCTLLLPDYATSIFEQDFISDIGPLIKKKYPLLLNEWISLANIANLKSKGWRRMKYTYFKTDGIHPDRAGHMVLLRTIFPDWVEYYKEYP